MFRRKGIHWIFCLGLVLSIYIFYNQLSGTADPNVKKVDFQTTDSDYNNKVPTAEEIMDNNVPINNLVKINVDVNQKQTIGGLKFEDALYVPFSFLVEYFGIYGEFSGHNSFKWYHVNPSFADALAVYPKYTTSAEYLSFQTSNVPKRARVICICGRHEVPITTQWDPKGYYYPTQIAQYGLSFLSKYYLESKSKIQKKLSILEENGLSQLFNLPPELYVLKIKFKDKCSPFDVQVLASDETIYTLSYQTDKTQIVRSKGGKFITHGIGDPDSKRNIVTRDLNVDLLKGLSYIDGGRNGKTINITIKRIKSISLTKVEGISHARLLEKDCESFFMAAANWFLNFQDENGGWKVNVKRAIRKGMEAKPGWYSAMGQGQAISLLSRVYQYTKDDRYLNAALKATQVFHRKSSEHGVKADLFGMPWYEEYPTQPPSFVLNGFMFSLFGLYDLWKIAGDMRGDDAKQLFLEGFKTLENTIPLFDNGHGTFYDLRHLSMPGISPNRARWQYHRVHLEQLTALLSIRKSKILDEVQKRWVGYVAGILSRHN